MEYRFNLKKKHSIKIDLFFLDRSYNLFFEKERRDTLTNQLKASATFKWLFKNER